jgi:hypothetical protein
VSDAVRLVAPTERRQRINYDPQRAAANPTDAARSAWHSALFTKPRPATVRYLRGLDNAEVEAVINHLVLNKVPIAEAANPRVICSAFLKRILRQEVEQLMTATTRSIDAGNYSARQIKDGLSIPYHDYISFTPNAEGNPTATVYRLGGPNGQIVCSIVSTYDSNGFLTSITRTV